jgi:hypothetical protein
MQQQERGRAELGEHLLMEPVHVGKSVEPNLLA